MIVEFNHPSCQTCDLRPHCEVMAQKLVRLEQTAKDIGFTVTEGYFKCEGRERLPEPFPSQCGVDSQAPKLASDEEKEKIAKLQELEAEMAGFKADIQQQVVELRA